MLIQNLKRLKIVQKISIVILILVSFLFLIDFWYKQDNTGSEVIFVLDIANTMNVRDVSFEDYKISRLEAGKKIMQNTINNIWPDTPVGIVIFAKKWNFLLPPTLDTGFVSYMVSTINTSFYDENTSDTMAWIRMILPADNTIKKVFVITDGDTLDTMPNQNTEWIDRHIVWIWSSNGGIVEHANGKPAIQNDNTIFSKMNKNYISDLSSALGWEYETISSTDATYSLDVNTKNTIIKKSDQNRVRIVFGVLVLFSLVGIGF